MNGTEILINTLLKASGIKPDDFAATIALVKTAAGAIVETRDAVARIEARCHECGKCGSLSGDGDRVGD